MFITNIDNYLDKIIDKFYKKNIKKEIKNFSKMKILLNIKRYYK